MNITFLIGNGFDMGLGMLTGYKNFYPYFLDMASDENIIKKQIENDRAKWNSFDKWSDLESALGEFLQHLSVEQSDKFLEDKVELEELLIKYLKKEREKIKLDEKEVPSIFINGCQSLRTWKVARKKQLIEEIFQYYKNETHTYQAISFNYTECVDDFFRITKNSNREITSHTTGGGVKYTDYLGEVVHIHGNIDGQEMILGVNDETQILNQELIALEDIQTYFIKSNLNHKIGQNKTSKAQKIIDESGIVCIYGMSLGATDKIWWQYIGQWLLSSTKRALIIFDYNPSHKGGHTYRVQKYQDALKDSFLLKAGIKDIKPVHLEDIKSRILIKTNENVFELNKSED